MSTINNCRHLRQLPKEELREFFNSFDFILCDCDGVIWLTVGSIPRAGEAIQLMKDKGKQVKFVSNNSIRSDKEYMEKFARLSVKDVKEDHVIHPAKTMAWYLNKTKPKAKVFPLIPQSAIDVLSSHGIETLPVDIDAYQFDSVTYTKFLLPQTPEEKVDAVLVDLNVYTGYAHLTKALQYLKDPDCALIFGAMDSVIPLTPNLIIPGFHGFYDLLTKHSQKQPTILGKPSRILGDFLKEQFSLTNPKRCLFIGDALNGDIVFGNSVGFQTLFVLTGCNTIENMLAAPEECKPDYYTEGIADFIELFSDI